jgi:hypothetical protein
MRIVINKHGYNDYSSKFINDCTEFKYYYAEIGENKIQIMPYNRTFKNRDFIEF